MGAGDIDDILFEKEGREDEVPTATQYDRI